VTATTKSPRRVLVIGWGFLGAAIGTHLRNLGVEVSGLTPTVTPRTLSAVEAGIDLTFDRAETPGVLSNLVDGVDHVVYTAGGLLPLEASRDPLRDAAQAVLPWIATLEAIRHHPHVGATLVSSGGTVYGNPVRIPVMETDVLRPVSAYGASREACEVYARTYASTYSLQLTVTRCANVYGFGQPHDRSQGAVAVFMHRIANQLPITLFGDGQAVRDYVHVDDVASAIAALVCGGIQVDVVNIGTGRGHTALELLEALAVLIGRRPVLRAAPARPHDVRAIVLDITRLTSLIAYDPMPLEEGLRLVWEQMALEPASNA
jgi:UDP-glucose 4-epimerase